MSDYRSRITIAALRGGSGKTIISLGLIATLREKGYTIAPFKKGPDFIDAGWLTISADTACHNLDPFLMTRDQITESFFRNSEGTDLSIIEGNRGLYDGMDLDGRFSTAELAKLLNSPVLLIIDVSMATRTMAAIVKGCQVFDPDLNIAGVILNRVAGLRQKNLIKESVEKYCNLPVVGSIPKQKTNHFPERHMGLVPQQEREHSDQALSWAKSIVKENLDLEKILKIAAQKASTDPGPFPDQTEASQIKFKTAPRIGYIMDRSFWFYYPENLHQLKEMGALLKKIDSISDKELPEIDALYIGGGFPETQARALADNTTFRLSLKKAIEKGLPVYAECGGLMYLGQSLLLDDNEYPMVGALPIKLDLKKKPQGHGYTILRAVRPNLYYPVGETIKGHEFHYSKAIVTSEEEITFAFSVERGHGIDGKRDGFCKNNLLASYTHIHAAGNRVWAKNFINAATCKGK